MKLMRLAGFLVASTFLMAAACVGGPVTVPGGDGATAPPIVSTAGSLRDEQALFAAEAAYNVAANAYVTADSRGLVSPDVRERVRPLLIQSYQALELARNAYRVGDASTFAEQAAESTSLAIRARDLIPK